MSLTMSVATAAALFQDDVAAYFPGPVSPNKIGNCDKEFTSPAFIAFLRTRQRTLEAMQPNWTFSQISQHIMEQWSRMSMAQQAPYIHEGKKFRQRMSNIRRPGSPTGEITPTNDYSSKLRRDSAGAMLYLASQWPKQGSKMAVSELKATAKLMRQQWQQMEEKDREAWRSKAEGESRTGVDLHLANLKEQLMSDWCSGRTEFQSKQRIMW